MQYLCSGNRYFLLGSFKKKIYLIKKRILAALRRILLIEKMFKLLICVLVCGGGSKFGSVG